MNSTDSTDPFTSHPTQAQPQQPPPPPPPQTTFGYPSTGWNSAYTTYPSYATHPTYPSYPTHPSYGSALPPRAHATSAALMSGMQAAVTRFARVSALIEDVLRNLHLLFDAVFGLGYSVGALRQEATLWLQLKTGPVGYIARVIARAGSIWKLLGLFLVSPLAGRFSPVALVLRILGLVPEEDPLGMVGSNQREEREEVGEERDTSCL